MADTKSGKKKPSPTWYSQFSRHRRLHHGGFGRAARPQLWPDRLGAGFTLLPHPQRLPRALPEIYQTLTMES